MKKTIHTMLVAILLMVTFMDSLAARRSPPPLPTSKYKEINTLVSNCPVGERFIAHGQDNAYNQYVLEEVDSHSSQYI